MVKESCTTLSSASVITAISGVISRPSATCSAKVAYPCSSGATKKMDSLAARSELERRTPSSSASRERLMTAPMACSQPMTFISLAPEMACAVSLTLRSVCAASSRRSAPKRLLKPICSGTSTSTRKKPATKETPTT